MNNTQKIGIKYTVISCLAVLLTFFFHELSHWSAAELLGYDMGLRLNLAFPLKDYTQTEQLMWKMLVVVGAGPSFTLLQACVFYLIMRKNSNYLFFPFLFTPFYMRLLAAIISFINLNDEANISKEIGIGAATLPLAICLILFFFLYDISRRKKYTARFLTTTFILTFIFSSILILSDMYFKFRVI